MTTGTALIDGLRMYYRVTGDGPAVVLLHGWPQTGHCWRLVEPVLAAAGYTVLTPDLRGYGSTDKPVGGYDKRTMAADVRGLVAALDVGPVHLVGHDRGARVAHRYALDHPDDLRSLTVLDIVPTLTTVTQTDLATTRNYWHWNFHQQPDLPELLVAPNLDGYLRYLFSRWAVQREVVDAEVAHYVAEFRRTGALRAGFDDYRATDQDVALDAVSRDAGQRVTVPVLALWGDGGLPSRLRVLDIWSEYADDVTGGPVEDCGHFVPEEQPDRMLEALLPFLDRHGGPR
jgi:haloacetate dehalogenase